ncbi:MAG: WD40/YVTN/BNR-like repeat-containing protein [Nitrospirota bacterium]
MTTYSIGLLRSLDRGETWSSANQGIRSFSLYRLVIDPRDPNRIYVGAGGGGLYLSEDAGATFQERNDGLGNTDIGFLALHPTRLDQLYVVTSTGVFRSPDRGVTWTAWNQGDRFTESQQCQDLVVVTSTKPETVLVASNRGVFRRREGDAAWSSASAVLAGRRITAMTAHPDGRRVWAAAFRASGTLAGGGLYESRDAGSSWRRVDRGLDQDWVRVIRFVPGDSRIVYAGTSTRGVLKSTDGGATWSPVNEGLGAPDVRSLAIAPSDPTRLYAGTHGAGVFGSTDGGAHWRALDRLPPTSPDEIIASLKRRDDDNPSPNVTPPPAFSKCNKCHGWTDPALNQAAHSLWLVPPNRRDWTLTVRRMRGPAGLSDAEVRDLAEFLTRYSESRFARQRAGRSGESINLPSPSRKRPAGP